MKVLNLANVTLLTTTLLTAQMASASCYDYSRSLSDALRRSTDATNDIDRGLDNLGSLIQALEDAARVVGSGGGKVDLRSELNPLVSNVEDQVRAAQGPLANGLSELRRALDPDQNLGSEVYRIAGRVAGIHANALSSVQNGQRAIDPLGTRIGELHNRLSNNRDLDRVRSNIQSSLRSLENLERSMRSLDLERLPRLVSDFNYSCNRDDTFRCRDLRAEMNSSADRSQRTGRDLDRSRSDLTNSSREVSRLADGLRSGSAPDLNGVLIGIINRDIVNQLADEANSLGTSSDNARAASTASSGVEFDRLIRDVCIPHAENASRQSSAVLSGISSLRTTIDSLARQIGEGVKVTPRELESAAQTIENMGRSIERSMEELAGRSGELDRLTVAMEDTRRYCERRNGGN